MNEGRLLQSVSNLIEKYERETISFINLENDVNLDVLQLSNLHKMDMVLSAVDIGSNVDILYEEKEAFIKSKPDIKEPVIQEKNYYEKCVSKIDPDAATKNIDKKFQTVNEEVNKSKAIRKYGKGYRIVDKKFTEASDYINKEIFDKLFDVEKDGDFDLENCLNCRKPADINGGLPPFEVNWEIKKFLDSLKSLLTDIKMSLDNTKQIADICQMKNLINQNNGLCLSSYPLILASFPIIISDTKLKLFELGISWTGLVGPLLMPVLKAFSKITEMLRGITIPIFDCLINSFKTMKSVLVASDGLIDSIASQVVKVSDTFTSFKREDIKNQIVISEKVKQDLKFKNQKCSQNQNKGLATEAKNPDEKRQPERKTYGIKYDSEEYAPAYRAGVYTATNLNNDKNQIMFLQNSFPGKVLDIVINKLTEARNIVDGFFNNVIYTLRAFQRVIIEPLYVSTKLIGELRVLANLARLINLVIKLSNSGLEICKDFDDSSKNSLLKSLVESTDSDVELDFVKNENGETFALVKSKTSDYKSRLRPNNCGEIEIDINGNQNKLDLIYDHLANSLGAK